MEIAFFLFISANLLQITKEYQTKSTILLTLLAGREEFKCKTTKKEIQLLS